MKGHSEGAKILKDIPEKSTSGNYESLSNHFRDRYDKLSNLIERRVNPRPIENLRRNQGKVSVVGMISRINTTKRGNKLVKLEDSTGSVNVIVRQDGILPDDVIGVTGIMSNGLLIPNSIVYPEISNKNEPNRGKRDGSMILTSDLHVGSKMFLEDAWMRFIRWLQQAEKVKYMVIGGDVVDGIGVYPSQERELSILDIYEQYEKAAEYLSDVPSEIEIIISPGNHDAVRKAEPQPPLPSEIRDMFDNNVTFVGNPALIELDGVKCLVYHGGSLEDIFTLPGMSHQEPDKAMIELLRRRHLAPWYGNHVSLFPDGQDHFVIDEVPDVLHCGHIHTVGISRYKRVLAVNSGAWQTQTDYQRQKNIEPEPGCATLIDLQAIYPKLLRFCK